MPFTSCLADPSVETCQLTLSLVTWFWQPPFELNVKQQYQAACCYKYHGIFVLNVGGDLDLRGERRRSEQDLFL